jgi:hypothetical protein
MTARRFRLPDRVAWLLALSGFPLAVHASGNVLVLYFSAGAALVQLILLPLFWCRTAAGAVKLRASFVYAAAVAAAWAVYLEQPASRAPLLLAMLLAFAPAGLAALVLRLARSRKR